MLLQILFDLGVCSGLPYKIFGYFSLKAEKGIKDKWIDG